MPPVNLSGLDALNQVQRLRVGAPLPNSDPTLATGTLDADRLILRNTPSGTEANANNATFVVATLSGDVTITFPAATGTVMLQGGPATADLDMDGNLILNIGAAGTDFTAGGGLTLAAGLTVSAGGATIRTAGANPLAVDNSNPDASVVNSSYIQIRTAGTVRWYVGQSVSAANGHFQIGNSGGSGVITIDKTTNVTTLSSGLTVSAGGVHTVSSASTRLSQSGEFNTVGAHGGVALNNWSNANQYPLLDFNKSRGTSAGTQAIVSSGDTLGVVAFRGSDGAAFQDAAYIQGVVDGTPSSGDMPGRLEFYTTPDGSTTGALAMTIGSTKLVTIASGLTVSAGNVIAIDGVRIGADSSNNEIDDASQGAGTTTLYIGNASINVTSDVRLKKQIRDTSLNALRVLNGLRVVDFVWDDPTDTAPVNRNSRGLWTGLIAQEIADTVPWVVNAPDRTCQKCRKGQKCKEHPSFWHVEYEHLVPAIVRAIQQIDARLCAVEDD